MPRDKNKKNMDLFRQLDWPDLKFNKKSITINKNGETFPLLSIEKGKCQLYFYWYEPRTGEYNSRRDVLSIKFSDSFDIGKIVSIRERDYRLLFAYLIKRILNAPNDINKIELVQDKIETKINNRNKSLKINSGKFIEVLNEAKSIYGKSKSHQKSYERYLTNIALEKFSKRRIERKTLISPGDINFVIQRLNLSTKKKKSDFNEYVNKSDIVSVKKLASVFIKHEMFDEDFLRKLNDYFIKESLKDIIDLGREILTLGSANMNTNKAKEVAFKVTGNRRKIKQLETLWQKYFEKYLLYLIFSYKGVFPKIKLTDIEGDKKHPDFIGINHYNGIDVIEIKTHLKNALLYDKSHENFAFSSELSKAVIQTMNYMDAVIHTNFKHHDDEEKITNSSHEENLNRPRGIIIISSYDKLVRNYQMDKNRETIVRDFTKLRNSVHNIEILTFDEILDIAHDYIQNIICEEDIL